MYVDIYNICMYVFIYELRPGQSRDFASANLVRTRRRTQTQAYTYLFTHIYTFTHIYMYVCRYL